MAYDTRINDTRINDTRINDTGCGCKENVVSSDIGNPPIITLANSCPTGTANVNQTASFSAAGTSAGVASSAPFTIKLYKNSIAPANILYTSPSPLGEGVYSTPYIYTFSTADQTAGHVDIYSQVINNCGAINSTYCRVAVVAAATTGTISCVTTPPGAQIYLDGGATSLGTTPGTLTNVSTGAHTVTFKLPGYNDCTVSVTVVAGQTGNLLLNAGFELHTVNQTVPDNWWTYYAGTVVPTFLYLNEIGRNSPKSIGITYSSIGLQAMYGQDADLTRLDRTQPCTLSGWISTYNISGAGGATIQIEWWGNNNTTYIGYTSTGNFVGANYTWTPQSLTGITIPKDISGNYADTARVVCKLANCSGTAWFDDISFESPTAITPATANCIMIQKITQVINISPNPINIGSQTSISDIVSGGSPPYTHVWNGLPPGCSSTAASFQCTPTVPGTYSVSDTVTDSLGNTGTSSAINLVVSAATGSISGTVTNISGVALSGATVSDGTRSAMTDSSGNYTISNVPTGIYTVTASASGYDNKSMVNVSVTAGYTTINVNFALVLSVAVTTGSIDCSTTPSGADVYIDGGTTSLGKTPMMLTNISAGSHTVAFKKLYYEKCTKSVTVTANQTVTASCVLTPTGIIDCSSTPVGAEIWFDGSNSNLVTPHTLTNIYTGSHTITFKLSGYNDCVNNVTVQSNVTTTVSCNMTTPGGGAGTVVIASLLVLTVLGVAYMEKGKKKP